MSIIETRQLCYNYGKKQILKQISFKAEEGEYVYILGPNGVGKSTLFRCIIGHLRAISGQILIREKEIHKYSAKQLAVQIAYIPQSCVPSFNYSLLQLVMLGRTAHLSAFSTPRKKDYEKAYEVLNALGLYDKKDQGICQVSGGERQLALIGRALVQEASIIIMDEPTSNLDYGNQIRLQVQMKKLTREGLLVIQSSHNPQYASLFADKVLALDKGEVNGFGKANEVITSQLIQKLYGVKVEMQNNMIIPYIE